MPPVHSLITATEFLVRKSAPDKVLDGLQPFIGKAKVLQTSLTKDKEEELRQALEGVAKAKSELAAAET